MVEWVEKEMKKKTDIMKKLKHLGRPDQLEGMARYGMRTENRYGVSIPNIREIAKETGKDHQLALQLWKTGITDARILASMVDIPVHVTPEQMEEWVKDFDSWDICDQVCMNLFDKTAYVRKKITEWAEKEEEFVKRAAFALIACLAVHDKSSPDTEFSVFFPLIQKAAADERNFVKKGVSWALRSIGKRSRELNRAALKFSEELSKKEGKVVAWIAADAFRDLTSKTTIKRLSRKP